METMNWGWRELAAAYASRVEKALAEQLPEQRIVAGISPLAKALLPGVGREEQRVEVAGKRQP